MKVETTESLYEVVSVFDYAGSQDLYYDSQPQEKLKIYLIKCYK